MARRRTIQLYFVGLIVLLVVLGLLTSSAHGLQFIVAAGKDWSDLASRVSPGDEILLMPGRHRPAALENLRGTKDKPIIIRGIDPKKDPTTIVADRYGLLLTNPEHVIVRDFIITGATRSGLEIYSPPAPDDPTRAPRNAHLQIENVTIERTGPDGEHDAIRLTGVCDVKVRRCNITGWGRSAIEIVGSRDVLIQNCTLTGLQQFSQTQAISIRGGARDVRVLACHIERPGFGGIAIGGASEPEHFRPALPEIKSESESGSTASSPTEAQPLYEAQFINIEDCTIIGPQRCAIAFVHSDTVTVRRNTIVNPVGWVFAMLPGNEANGLAGSRRGSIAMNLITWEPGAIERLVYVSRLAEADSFTFGPNVWWSGGEVMKMTDLPGQPAEQLTNVDPALDAAYQVTAVEAQGFGAPD